MNIVRPNHFDRRNGAWSAPDWVWRSGTTFRYRYASLTSSGISGITHQSVSREIVELFRSYNAAKVAEGGNPFFEACVYCVATVAKPRAFDFSTLTLSTGKGGAPLVSAEELSSAIETWKAANEANAERWRAAVWWAIRQYRTATAGGSTYYKRDLYIAEPSEYYPTEFVAFNLRGDYGAPNTYDRHYYVDEEDTGDGATAANWYNIDSRPLVVVENLTVGERVVLRSIDDHGPTHNSGAPCPLYGTFFLKRGNDYRITRYRAVYAETVERAPWKESTELMKYHRFDALPPTTQTVAASEFATATYFDLEI